MIDRTAILVAESRTSERTAYAETLRRLGRIHFVDAPLRVVADAVQLENLALAVMVLPSAGWEQSLEATRILRRSLPWLSVVVVSEIPGEETAIEMFREGVVDYLRAPVSSGSLVASLSRLLAKAQSPGGSGRPLVSEALILGRSPQVERLRRTLPDIAAADCAVLITGETGTGKELVARAIHDHSVRAQNPFVAINCAALPDSLLESELFGHERGAFTGAVAAHEGKFQQASGGTLLLDEIGDMSPCAQAKILRSLETGKIQKIGGRRENDVDVRVVAATNQDLQAMMARGAFRADLLYRLNVAHVRLAPLRERREDIPVLLDHFLRWFNRKYQHNARGFSRASHDVLVEHAWPGNVRELRNVVEGCLIARPYPSIEVEHLPWQFQPPEEVKTADPAAECERIVLALTATQWNKTKAAEKLHWSRMTLYRKLVHYGIQEPVRPVRKEALTSPDAALG